MGYRRDGREGRQGWTTPSSLSHQMKMISEMQADNDVELLIDKFGAAKIYIVRCVIVLFDYL